MPSEERPHDLVVRIDLRQGWRRIAEAPGFDQLVQEALRGSGLERADASRALVIGSARSVTEELAAYERVRTAIEFDTVLCFLVGPPEGESIADPSSGAVVRDRLLLTFPSFAAPPKGGVVWAGDTPGVGWQPGRNGVVAYDSGGEAGAAGAGEDRDRDRADAYGPLIEVLSLPEIFDDVLDGLTRLPKGVGAVGARMLLHDLPASRLRRMLRLAVEQLAETFSGGSSARAASTDFGGAVAVLTAARPSGVTIDECLIPGGFLQALDEDCARRLADIEDCFAELRRPSRLLGLGPRLSELPEALTEAADTLQEYKGVLADVLYEIDGADGLPSGASARLAALGVDLPDPPDVAARQVDTALRSVVDDHLSRHTPLRDTAAVFADLARRLAPTGSAPRAERVLAACPDGLGERMAQPPPFRARTGGWFGLPAGALVCLLGGLSPTLGFILAPTLVLTLSILTRLMSERCPDPRCRGGNRTDTLTSAAASLAGAVVGTVAGRVFVVPAAAGFAVAAVAVVLAALLSVQRYRIAVDDWYDAVGMYQASNALRVMRGELAAAVLEDWLLADARLRASDAARALGIVLTRIADTLSIAPGEPGSVLGALAAPGAGEGGAGAGRRASGGGRDDRRPGEDRTASGLGGLGGLGGGDDVGTLIEKTLVGDVADLVAEMLSANWRTIGGDPRTAAELPIEAELRTAVNALWRHLRRHGVAEPPTAHAAEGRPDRPDRPDPARLAGLDPAGVRDAVLADDTSPEVRQLCTIEHLRMLENEPDISRWVRFAHRTLREALVGGADVWDADSRAASEGTGGPGRAHAVRWTTSSRFAGALRLTPLKPNAARPADDRRARRRDDRDDWNDRDDRDDRGSVRHAEQSSDYDSDWDAV